MLVDEVRDQVEHLPGNEGLRWVANHFHQAKFASSLGEEDQVITHLIASQ